MLILNSFSVIVTEWTQVRHSEENKRQNTGKRFAFSVYDNINYDWLIVYQTN